MANLKALATAFVALSAFLGGAAAHPGETHTPENVKKALAYRELAEDHAKQVTKTCTKSGKHQSMQQRAAARRSLTAQLLREKRNIVDKPMKSKRDQPALNKWINSCHDRSSTHNYDLSTAEASIFASNATHALTPETILGPYFVAGEVIRSDVVEEEEGVPIHLDIQFIDINTCDAVPNMLVDIWHCNAEGVYSGVAGNALMGQGGLNTTFLRGIQVTDHDGVVQFDSIFPGHYLGRTNHIHVASRRSGKILSNGTYTGGTVNHIGQLYFDQELVTVVESVEPYTKNWMPLTSNRQDFLTADEATADYDPFVDYVMLSDDSNDGLLMWITIGINATADYNALAHPAATWQKGGGVANSMPLPFPINGTAWPSGVPMPTGMPSGGMPGGGMPGGTPSMGGSFPGLSTTSTAKGSAPTPKPWGPCMGRD